MACVDSTGLHNVNREVLLQGIPQSSASGRPQQQTKLEEYARKLNQGSPSGPSVSHPLTSVPTELRYQPQQLQPTPPQAPQV